MSDLEHLYKKPIPITKKVWAIGINPEKKNNIVIVDKRNERTIDRKMIMDRIRNVKAKDDEPNEKEEEKGKEKGEEKEEEKEEPKEIKKKPTKFKIVIKEKENEKVVIEEKEEVIIEEEKEKEKEKVKIKVKVKVPKKKKDIEIDDIVIDGVRIGDRKPKPSEKFIYKASSYYMNNRLISIKKLTQLFHPYQKELADTANDASCDAKISEEIKLLTHQKVVRDYLNLYTPYRGLLILHALGSGKTCTSIAIAEGLKSDKQIFVLTPASLKMNFFSELKRCGDHLFRKNQFWEFVSTVGQQDLVATLASALSISQEFIKKHNGAWLVDVNKPANFTELSTFDQSVLDEQLNEMIRSKYKDINYNGLNKRIVDELTKDSTINPFDHSVVVIDEAHNFVSRIVNKISKQKSISYKLYEYLMKATDVRIVMLTGTPIINYPNEIGVLYNILRGYVKTWTFNLKILTGKKVNRDAILLMFSAASFNTYDFIEYSGNKLTITRNPFGFINTKKNANAKAETEFEKYNGVKLDITGNISDSDFEKTIISILKNNDIEVNESAITIEMNKALPDDSDAFLNMFVDPDSIAIKNDDLFKRRILGLTSYFPSSSEKLLPSFVKTEKGEKYHIVKSEMSEYQFGIYVKIRKEEADKERASRKNKTNKADELYQSTSTYRVRSRTCCNFAFPDPPGRPLPDKQKYNEKDIDGLVDEEEEEEEPKEDKEENEESKEKSEDYPHRIQKALKFLKDNSSDYFTPDKIQKYSPKFFDILENVNDPANIGLHLIYSQFYTVEGIGLLKLLLETNGYSQFSIVKKSGNVWNVENTDDKPKFFLYTGNETIEEKEILRNIYNSQWDFVPESITNELKKTAPNNYLGEIVKIMMITSSGAEGINLKNTRFVHIVEPYWHMVRIDQVIGRARRICSHQALPEELRTVKVFLYLATLSEEQRTNEDNKELTIRDVSKLNKKTPITTDESLYESAQLKDNINQQILRCVKESAVDCSLYAKTGKENLICYGYGNIESNNFSSHPSIDIDQHQKPDINVVEKKLKLKKITFNKVDYAWDPVTNVIYDMENREVGKLIETNGTKTIEFLK
jgi:hypothetical protein